MSTNYVYWLDELGDEHNDVVGKKSANLGKMTKLGMPIPPGFALPLDAYNAFMTDTGAIEEIKRYLARFRGGLKSVANLQRASEDIRQIVDSKRMPKDIEGVVLISYATLSKQCNVEDVAVSVRSAGVKSRPGQYETCLSVRGRQRLIEKIIRVWSSTFGCQAIASRVHEGLPIESDPIGVAVLKMVNAHSAGVAFTANPNTGDSSQIIVEACWGLGESVVGGLASPDRYIVDKNTLDIRQRTIGDKCVKVTSKEQDTIEEGVPSAQRDIPCLLDKELIEIARLAKELELQFGEPQDIEWAIDSDLSFPRNIFLLQTRPVVIAKRASPMDRAIDRLMQMEERQQADKPRRF